MSALKRFRCIFVNNKMILLYYFAVANKINKPETMKYFQKAKKKERNSEHCQIMCDITTFDISG